MISTVSDSDTEISRRHFLSHAAAAGCLALPLPARAQRVVRLEDYGGSVHASAAINRRALQAALNSLAGSGGTIRIAGSYRCGQVVLTGRGVTIDGTGGTLFDARIVVARQAADFAISGLTMVDTTGTDQNYHLDIAGSDGRLSDISLIKRPIAGGYQMYLRHTSSQCTFNGLTLRGSNGVFVAGIGHNFNRFDFQSTLSRRVGGDDAFAIKGAGSHTSDITIANGRATGFSSVVSIGSEIGRSGTDRRGITGSVRNVTIRDIVADRCARILYIKAGALIYDWRNGLIENIRLDRARLTDPTGYLLTTGINITAARGAVVRNVVARDIVIEGRAASLGVMPTSAIDINIRNLGTPSRIENIDIAATFTDPHAGRSGGGNKAGHPVDYIVRIEKEKPSVGSMRDISLDIRGEGSRFGGVYVGAGLDGAVTFRNLALSSVAQNPPSSLGAGGIWSDSRIALGSVAVTNIGQGRKFDGKGF